MPCFPRATVCHRTITTVSFTIRAEPDGGSREMVEIASDPTDVTVCRASDNRAGIGIDGLAEVVVDAVECERLHRAGDAIDHYCL